MLTELTEQHKILLQQKIDKWLNIGLSTDNSKIHDSINVELLKKAYEQAGLNAPKNILYAKSPLDAYKQINKVSAKKISASSFLNSVFSGNHNAYFNCINDFYKDVGIEITDKIDPFIELSENVGWISLFDEAAVFISRPIYLAFDERKLLHSETRSAIEYEDGFSVYAWHGTSIPAEWIRDKSLDAATALKVDNLEQRRCACEILGWNHILNELNATLINKGENAMVGDLFEVELPDIGKEKFLRVMCGTKREFALPVPPDMERASQAQAWLNFTTEDQFKPQLRT